jgi:transposase
LALRERLGTQLGRETHSPVRVSSILSRPRRAEWAANSEGTTEEVRRFSRPQATPARGYGRLGPQSKGSQRQKLPDQDAINKLLLKLLLKAARQRLPRLSYLWVDAGYQGSGKEWVEQEELGLSVEVVHRTPKPTSEKIARIWAQEWAKEGREIDWQKLPPRRGFELVSRRWVVERTFSWLSQNRRMSKDYERWCATSEAFIYAAMARLMVRRLASA